MIDITKSEIVRENLFELFKKKLGANKMPKVDKQYGITHLQAINKNTIEIAGILTEKLKDGFQITDTFAGFALFGRFKNIGSNWEQAKLEYGELDNMESSQLSAEILSGSLELAGVDLDNVGNRGIDDFMFVLTKVGDLYELINDKLADGWQAEDLDTLPEFTIIVAEILKRLEQATLDVKDLKGREYVQAIKYLVFRIHGALIKPNVVIKNRA